MVTTFYPPYHFGGDAVFVQALSRRLVAEGHAVDVVHCVDAYRLRGTGSPPREQDWVDEAGVKVHSLHHPLGPISPLITQQTGRPGLKRQALREILQQTFDAIHFHNISLVGGPAVLEMGSAPVKLYTTHEHWLVCPTHVLWKNGCRPCDKPECLKCCLLSRTPPQLWRYGGLIERSLMHVDAILSPSRFTAQRHREGGVTRPIHVLPTFSPLDSPAHSVRFDPPQRVRYLYAGRLTRSKGIVELVELFKRHPQHELVVAGDGELAETLRHSASSSPNVQFVGAVSARILIELYHQATAVIMPCIGPEVFPLVPIEAMACGTPVIVREAGGSAEAVEQTGGGIVYHTEEELISAIDRLSTDQSYRNELAQRAQAGYLQHYTAQQHLEGYLKIVESIRSAKTAPALLEVTS
jgi:glycosyltransferase involved in cell wall biosynthesis